MNLQSGYSYHINEERSTIFALELYWTTSVKYALQKKKEVFKNCTFKQ